MIETLIFFIIKMPFYIHDAVDALFIDKLTFCLSILNYNTQNAYCKVLSYTFFNSPTN